MRRAAFIAAVGALASAGSGQGADARRPAVAAGRDLLLRLVRDAGVDGAWQHWGQGGNTPPQDIGSDFYPARGPYSSGPANVVRAQMREIAATGSTR